MICEQTMVGFLEMDTHGLKLIESTYGTYVYDGHGNVTQLLGSDLTVKESYGYDPFGKDLSGRDIDMAEEMSEQSPMLMPLALDGLIIHRAAVLQNPYRYCGEYYDVETGYVYLRARYYDPSLGRFISEDSAHDGYNWYVYCGNDPINRIDPSGYSFIDDAVAYWYEGIGVLQRSGTAGQIFASYSLGVMDTISGQIKGIGSFVSDPIGSVVNGWNSFIENPLVNNPISQMGIGVYNFYSGLATASASGDWNSVAYSLGGATVVAGELAASYAIGKAIRSKLSVKKNGTLMEASNETPLACYDPEFAAQQMLSDGYTTESLLRSMIPKGTPNSFKPSSMIKCGYKYRFSINGTQIELKWHSPDLVAASKYPGCNSGSMWTAQVKVGKKLLGADGSFYKSPSNITHIPLKGR